MCAIHLACSRCERLTGVGAGSCLATFLARVDSAAAVLFLLLGTVFSVVAAASCLFLELVVRCAELAAGVSGEEAVFAFLPRLVVTGTS